MCPVNTDTALTFPSLPQANSRFCFRPIGMTAAPLAPHFYCPHIPVASEHSTAKRDRSGEAGQHFSIRRLQGQGSVKAHMVSFPLAKLHILSELAGRHLVQDP